MRYALELYFDPEADRAVRDLWSALRAAGLPARTPAPGPGYRPHVSLAVWRDGDLERLGPDLGEAVASARGLPLRLAALGVFVDDGPELAFLAVTPSTGLVRLQAAVAGVLAAATGDCSPHYRPGSWMPHCTLPLEVGDGTLLLSVLRGGGLPVAATVTEAHVVDVACSASLVRLL